MKFDFKKLSQHNALIIANEWKYDGEYFFYDMTADLEDYEEFVDEDLRNKNDHYEATVNNELIGFFCIAQENYSIEIGLGLRPDVCGKGIGKEFLNQILNFINNNYKFNKLIMNVATFNKRAIKVYHSCGFEDYKLIKQKSNDGIYEFLTLVKER